MTAARLWVLMLCLCRVQIALHSIGYIYICIYIKNSQLYIMMRVKVSNYLCISIVSSLMLKDRVAKRLSYQTSDLRVAGSNPVSVKTPLIFCFCNAISMVNFSLLRGMISLIFLFFLVLIWCFFLFLIYTYLHEQQQ